MSTRRPRHKAKSGQAKREREIRDVTPVHRPARRIRSDATLASIPPPARCPLCGHPLARYPYGSRHHVVPKGGDTRGDDLPCNIVWICGNGTTGCHGLIEAYDWPTRRRLREHLERERPAVIRYVAQKMGKDRGLTAAEGLAWLDARYPREAA